MKCLYWLLVIGQMAAALQVGAQEAPFGFNRASDPVLMAARKERLRYADNLRIEGEKALSKGEKAKAVTLFLQSIKVDDTALTSRMLLADIYIKDNRPSDMIAILQPAFYSSNGVLSVLGQDVRWCMKYILALLDVRRWEEAATLYEKGLDCGIEGRKGNLRWDIPGFGIGGANGKGHFLPDVHFSPDVEDVAGLRTQAHLILGSRLPTVGNRDLYGNEALIYMLDQSQQALKSDRHSLDAQFLSGVVLGELGRFDEARKAFAGVAKNAPKEAQPEITAAVARYALREETQKNYEAQLAKKQAEQNALTPGKATP